MSWQAYVDDHLMCEIEGNFLSSAAIIGLDGTVWAQSPNFPQLKPEEITGITNEFNEPGTLAPTGLHLSGTKYMVIQGEPGAVIRGKKGAGGVTIKKTTLAYIFGIYDEPMTPGQCNFIVERLGDNLLEQDIEMEQLRQTKENMADYVLTKWVHLTLDFKLFKVKHPQKLRAYIVAAILLGLFIVAAVSLTCGYYANRPKGMVIGIENARLYWAYLDDTTLNLNSRVVYLLKNPNKRHHCHLVEYGSSLSSNGVLISKIGNSYIPSIFLGGAEYVEVPLLYERGDIQNLPPNATMLSSTANYEFQLEIWGKINWRINLFWKYTRRFNKKCTLTLTGPPNGRLLAPERCV